MNTRSEHEKLLRHVEALIAQAPDEATREDLLRLRERLDTPEMLALARELAASRAAPGGSLVLEFHDPLLPMTITATGCVIATAVCLFAIVEGVSNSTAVIGGQTINLWLVAVFAGACSALFTALSFMRMFSVRVDTTGMMLRSSGSRWQNLRVGAMVWRNIRSLHERAQDRILEVRAAGGELFEIPMRLVNYPILRQHLDNMVMLYGDRPAGAAATSP
jgi:hypothetical protein